MKNTSIISDLWSHPVEIARSNFKHKSLSCWSMNTTVGCSHGCRFCYVPSVTGIFQRTALAEYGVQDPDLDWGAYAFLRPWDEKKFRASLRSAERTPVSKLNSDGHRAVMLSTTTDAYQVIRNPDPAKQKELNTAHRQMVRRALELILSESTLNVRILTRSPWAREDFDLFKEFGHRLTFGMSLPTLRDDWRKVYEPKAPSVAKRLETLRAAKEAGLHVYVAVAPTYPECDEADLRSTLEAVAELEPLTIFTEPINIRAKNAERIRVHGESIGVQTRTDVFESTQSWRRYALEQLYLIERLSTELGISDRIHLWPDSSLGSKAALREVSDPDTYSLWLRKWWSRISEWPLQE